MCYWRSNDALFQQNLRKHGDVFPLDGPLERDAGGGDDNGGLLTIGQIGVEFAAVGPAAPHQQGRQQVGQGLADANLRFGQEYLLAEQGLQHLPGKLGLFFAPCEPVRRQDALKHRALDVLKAGPAVPLAVLRVRQQPVIRSGALAHAPGHFSKQACRHGVAPVPQRDALAGGRFFAR